MRSLIKTDNDLISANNRINELLVIQDTRELTDKESNELENLQIEVDSYCEN